MRESSLTRGCRCRTLERTLPAGEELLPATTFPRLTAVVETVDGIPEVAEHLRLHPYVDLTFLVVSPPPSLLARVLRALRDCLEALTGKPHATDSPGDWHRPAAKAKRT